MSKKQLFRLILAIIGSIGVFLQLKKDGFGMLLYYTVLSNLLVILFLFYLVYKESKTPNLSLKLFRIKGGVTMAITITFLVYHFLLSPYVKHDDYWNIRNFIVHYIVPLSFIFDTLILDPKKQYRWYLPFYWTLFPLIYFAFALMNGLVFKLAVPGSVDSPYPYYFINLSKYGISGVAQNSLFIFIGYIIVGYILYLLKYFIGKSYSK